MTWTRSSSPSTAAEAWPGEMYGLCGNPIVTVEAAADTERLQDGSGEGAGPTLERIPLSNLSAAEREAF